MKDPIAQATLNMNAGISKTFSSEDRAKANSILEKKAQLENDISAAQVLGEEWVETSAEVIRYLNPQGLGKERYFWYRNICVCEEGKKKEIIEELSNRDNVEKAKHGGTGTYEGTIMGPQLVKPKFV